MWADLPVAGGIGVVSLCGMKTTLLGPKRPSVVSALEKLALDTINGTGGITGMALKGLLKAAQSARSDVVPTAIDAVLPELATALEPYWDTYSAGVSQSTFGEYLTENSEAVAGELAQIADGFVEGRELGGLTKLYTSARNKGIDVLKQHLDSLGDVLEGFM